MMNVSIEPSEMGISSKDSHLAESTKLAEPFGESTNLFLSSSAHKDAPYASPPRVSLEAITSITSQDHSIPDQIPNPNLKAVADRQQHEIISDKLQSATELKESDVSEVSRGPEEDDHVLFEETKDHVEPSEPIIPIIAQTPPRAVITPPVDIPTTTPFDAPDFIFFAESERPGTPGEFIGGTDDGFDYGFTTTIQSGRVVDDGAYTYASELPTVDVTEAPLQEEAELTNDWSTAAMYQQQAKAQQQQHAYDANTAAMEGATDHLAAGEGQGDEEVLDEETYIDATSGYLLPYPDWIEREYKGEVQMTQYGYITPAPPVRTPPYHRRDPGRLSGIAENDTKKRRRNRVNANEEKKRRARTNSQSGEIGVAPGVNSSNVLGLNLDLQSLAALTQLNTTLQQFGFNGLNSLGVQQQLANLSGILAAANAAAVASQPSTPGPNGGMSAATVAGLAPGNANAALGQLGNLGNLGLLYNPLVMPAAAGLSNAPMNAFTQALQQQYLLSTLQTQLLNQQIMQQNGGQMPTPGGGDPMRIPMEYLGLYGPDALAGSNTPGIPMSGLPPASMAPMGSNRGVPSPHDVADMMSRGNVMGMNRGDGMSPPIETSHAGFGMGRGLLDGNGQANPGNAVPVTISDYHERKQRVPQPVDVDDVTASIGVSGSGANVAEMDGDLDWNKLIGETFPSFSDARIVLRANPHRGVVYGPDGDNDVTAEHRVETFDDLRDLPSLPQEQNLWNLGRGSNAYSRQLGNNDPDFAAFFGLAQGQAGDLAAQGFDLYGSQRTSAAGAYGAQGKEYENDMGWFDGNWGPVNSGSGEQPQRGNNGNDLDVMSGSAANSPNHNNASPPSQQPPAASDPNSTAKKNNSKKNVTDSGRQKQLFSASLTFKGRVATYAQDNRGCKILQHLLDMGNPAVFYMIYTETLPVLCQLMTDRFGNYLCQKIVDYSAREQRIEMLNAIGNDLVSVSQSVHGTRVVQKLISCVESEIEQRMIAGSLSGSVATLTKDLSGNHVMHSCLRYIPPPEKCDDVRASNQFVYDELSKNLMSVATHKHGCCVLQRCLDHGTEAQADLIACAIVSHAYELSQDAFGNYVVQYVMMSNKILLSSAGNAIDAVYDRLRGRLPQLSVQKFSSNVVERCLVLSSSETKRSVIDELMQEGSIRRLIQDRYGNYVIQKVLEVAKTKDENFETLIDKVRPYVQALGETEFGQRIQKNFVARFPTIVDHHPTLGMSEHFVEQPQHGSLSTPHLVGMNHDMTQHGYDPMPEIFGNMDHASSYASQGTAHGHGHGHAFGFGSQRNFQTQSNVQSPQGYGQSPMYASSRNGPPQSPFTSYGDVSDYGGYGAYSNYSGSVYNYGMGSQSQHGGASPMHYPQNQFGHQGPPSEQYAPHFPQYGGYSSHGVDYFH